MGTYITITDIDNITINDLYNNGNEDLIQLMIDKTNLQLDEKVSGEWGLDVASIIDPIPQIVKDWLAAELCYRIGSAFITSNDPQGTYNVLYNLGMTNKERLEPKITSTLVTNGAIDGNVQYTFTRFERG